jgi:hypothetical protein
MMEGMNSTMIYCMNFYKCHNAPQYNMIIKKILKEKNADYAHI